MSQVASIKAVAKGKRKGSGQTRDPLWSFKFKPRAQIKSVQSSDAAEGLEDEAGDDLEL